VLTLGRPDMPESVDDFCAKAELRIERIRDAAG
jgi:hypothetical protein